MCAALTGMSGGAGLSPSRGVSEKVRRVGRAIIMVVAGLWSCCSRKGVQQLCCVGRSASCWWRRGGMAIRICLGVRRRCCGGMASECIARVASDVRGNSHR